MEFLGFIIDSILLRVTLPIFKKVILKELFDVVTHRNVSACEGHNDRGHHWEYSKVAGKMSSSYVTHGKVHYRKLERVKTLALAW